MKIERNSVNPFGFNQNEADPALTWGDTVFKVAGIFFFVALAVQLTYLGGRYLAGRIIISKPTRVNFFRLGGFAVAVHRAREYPTQPNNNWEYRQFTIPVDRYTIDATVAKRPNRFKHPERWTLMSPKTGGLCEEMLPTELRPLEQRTFTCLGGEVLDLSDFHEIIGDFLDQIDSNALLFNYPANAPPSTITKTYQIMIQRLEEEHKAKEIIGYGYSLGSLVQGAALENYPLQKEGVRYLFIKHGPPANMYAAARDMYGSIPAGLATLVFGWNLNSVLSSLQLEAQGIHEIIITPKQDHVASLAKVLSGQKFQHKTFLSVTGSHTIDTFPRQGLAERVNALFSSEIDEIAL